MPPTRRESILPAPEGQVLELKDLETCKINIIINLEPETSTNFSPAVYKALEEVKGQKIETQLGFFIPSNARTAQDKVDHKEEIASVFETLEEWTEAYYGYLLVPGYSLELVQHVISYVFCICPQYPVLSREFLILTKCSIVAALIDDWMDSYKKNMTQEGDCGGVKDAANQAYKDRLELSRFAMEVTAMFFDFSTEMDFARLQEEASTYSQSYVMDMANREPISAASADALTDILDNVKELHPDFFQQSYFNPFKMIVQQACEADLWFSETMGLKTTDNYSEETCRYFRQMVGALDSFTASLELLEGDELRRGFNNSVIFIKWNDIAAKMAAIQNDFLGFQKDVRGGEEDGMIMQKIRKGLSVRAAIDDELKLFRALERDYVALRRILLKSCNKKREEDVDRVRKFISVVDSFLFGYFLVFRESKKYGMAGQIEIITDSGIVFA